MLNVYSCMFYSIYMHSYVHYSFNSNKINASNFKIQYVAEDLPLEIFVKDLTALHIATVQITHNLNGPRV